MMEYISILICVFIIFITVSVKELTGNLLEVDIYNMRKVTNFTDK